MVKAASVIVAGLVMVVVSAGCAAGEELGSPDLRRSPLPRWLGAPRLVAGAERSAPLGSSSVDARSLGVAPRVPPIASPPHDGPAAIAPLPPAPKPHSAPLPSGFFNPMPGGVMAGYQADTGLDIAGSPRPVYALAAGTLDYSEPGHTLWTGPSDTANCVRFELDVPIPWKGRRITHVYYAHLSRLEQVQREGEARRHVEGGERLGLSGVANHSPHLHIGLLLDGEVEQYRGTFLLADEVRKVLGGYRNGDVLPRGPSGEAW
jgi:hypothetical protein